MACTVLLFPFIMAVCKGVLPSLSLLVMILLSKFSLLSKKKWFIIVELLEFLMAWWNSVFFSALFFL